MEQTMHANWRDKIKFGEDRPSPQILSEDGNMRVIVAGLHAGQTIPVHAEEKAVYCFLEGQGQMTVNEEIIDVSPGVTIVVSQGDKRGVHANTELAFLAVRVL